MYSGGDSGSLESMDGAAKKDSELLVRIVRKACFRLVKSFSDGHQSGNSSFQTVMLHRSVLYGFYMILYCFYVILYDFCMILEV